MLAGRSRRGRLTPEVRRTAPHDSLTKQGTLSLPYNNLGCSECSLAGDDLATRISVVYELGPGQDVMLLPVMAFCEACQAFRAAECLLPRGVADDRMKDARAYFEGAKRPVGPFGILGRRFPKDRTHLRQSLEYEIERCQRMIAIWKRRTPGLGPRCLECGSDMILMLSGNEARDWDRIPLDFEYDMRGPRDSTEPHFTGIHHPGCGGEFYTKSSSPLRVGTIPGEVRLTPDGEVKIRRESQIIVVAR